MKNQLKSGIIYLALGIAFIALCFIFPEINIFFGFAGACIGPGLLMIYKHYYWQKRPEEYKRKLEDVHIELHDERKEMIRGKASRISHLANWILISIATVTISLLGQFGVISIELSKYVILAIAVYWILSLVLMQIIFKYISSKY